MKESKDSTKKNVKISDSNRTDSEKIFFIKSPSGKRKSWAIVSFVYAEDRKRIYLPFNDERVKGINKKFKEGTVDSNSARVMLEEIIDGLYKRNKNVKMLDRRRLLNEENQKLFNDFWNDVYEGKLFAPDSERSAKNDFDRALFRAEPASLYISSAKEITAALKKNCRNVNQHRRAVDRLNEILTYLKRDIRLPKPAEPFKQVEYLTEDQVFALSKKASSEELTWLVLTLFGTGARLGEALALTSKDHQNGAVYIEKQLAREGDIRPPKRGKKGWAPIIPSTEKFVKLWLKVENKGMFRDAVYDFVSEKCPGFSPHDLRHSYAIHCLSKGMSLGMVANSLRNRIEVCQKYYTGYEHNADTLEAAKKMLA